MNTKIFKNIVDNIRPKSTVILAFSGGPDSVYLFHQLLEAKKKVSFKIILAHLNHKLRGKESDKDEKFCLIFAKESNTPIEIEKKNIAAIKGNLEDNARKSRYVFLEKVRQKYKADFILTAHHLDDNMETFLMNFLRGSGLKGLSGMQIKSFNILRPLLGITKDEILKYLKENHISFCTDKTNFDDSYTRNNIRKNIVPLLKKIQPSLKDVFLRNWETLSETQQFIDREAEKWIRTNMRIRYKVPIEKFKNVDRFMQAVIIKNLFNLYHQTNDNLSKDMVERARKIINEEKTGKNVPFGKNTLLIINYDSFEITPKNKQKQLTRKKLKIPGETEYSNIKISLKIIKKTPKNLSKNIYLDYSKCDFPLYVRGKKDGDKFRNIGMKGTQKLQDFFVNKKIPNNKRGLIPLIVDKNDEIIAVGSMAVSDLHKITANTKKIISVSF